MNNFKSAPKIMAIEEDELERKEISDMLKGYEVSYERSIIKAMSKIGTEDVDCVLVDADCSSKLFSWKKLTDFLKGLNLKYLVFSSNGKVGMVGGQKVIHINQIADTVNGEFMDLA